MYVSQIKALEDIVGVVNKILYGYNPFNFLLY